MLLDILGKLAKLSLIIAARYVAVAGGAYWLFWGGGARLVRQGRLNRKPPTRTTIRHEVVTSLVASPIYALPVAVVMAMWERGGTAIYAPLPPAGGGGLAPGGPGRPADPPRPPPPRLAVAAGQRGDLPGGPRRLLLLAAPRHAPS